MSRKGLMSFAIGVAAGLFGGLVGLGGGVIMIPLMIRFAGLSQHQAHGTSLMALVFTGLTGAAVYGLKGTVVPLAAIFLAATAMVSARFGALLAHSLAEWKLKLSFGVFITVVSLLLLARSYQMELNQAFQPVAKLFIYLASGTVSGFIAGLMGVGGGSIMVPALVLLAGFSQHQAQGTSLLAMVPAGAMGSYTHWRLGNVILDLVPGLAAGIMTGTAAGGLVAHLLSESSLRLIFAGVLIWQGLRDIHKSLALKKNS